MVIKKMIELAELNGITPTNWSEIDGKILWTNADGDPEGLMEDNGKLCYFKGDKCQVIWNIQDKISDAAEGDAILDNMMPPADHEITEEEVKEAIHQPYLEEYGVNLDSPELTKLYTEKYNARREKQ